MLQAHFGAVADARLQVRQVATTQVSAFWQGGDVGTLAHKGRDGVPLVQQIVRQQEAGFACGAGNENVHGLGTLLFMSSNG